jgi:serine/threonine protein kinase
VRDTGGKYNRRVLETVAHYRILERLGESRLGEIFRARDTRLGRSVALTIPADDIQNDPAARAQLLADAQRATSVSHPNIAALYECGDDAGRMYLALEFVPGEPLERVIAGHPLNPRRALDLTIQVADGLAEAHAAEMPHGALTARTVVVTPKGNAKILDFGFARWTAANEAGGDDASDLEALRALLFEMLTGRPHGTTLVAPTTLNKSLPAEMDGVVSKTYESAVVFAAELRALAAVLETRAEAARSTRPTPIRGRSRRSNTPLIAGVLAIVAVAIAAAAYWWLR